jgi:MazG nucleotide pyrophosphohydrolase domain.
MEYMEEDMKEKIIEAVKYFDEQVGHFTDSQKVMKIREEVNELDGAIELSGKPEDVIEECSDVLAIAYHIAKRNGYTGTPGDLFMQAYEKMKRRIESGERDYKNRDF